MSWLDEKIWANSFYEPYDGGTFFLLDSKVAERITKDGKFCLGWVENECWKPFQFGYDATIVSKIIENFLKKQKRPESEYDTETAALPMASS